MKQRLEEFIAAENISKAQFADRIKVARAAISHIMAGRNNPSYEFIVNTMEAFPYLNIEWLLQGKGSMYKNSDNSDQYNDGSLFFNSQPLIEEEPQQPQPQAQVQTPSQTQPLPESIAAAPLPLPTQNLGGKSKIKKIVVFFDDGTYQEFC